MFYRNEYDKIYNIYRTNVILESEQTDGADLKYSGEMDEEQFKKFQVKLGRAKLWLYKRNEFLVYANILSDLKTVPCREIVSRSGAKAKIDTMAVDKLGNIFINPEFLEKLSDGEVIGVLVHETFHHLNLTFQRQGIRDMKRWNIATDYIMNRDILKDGLDLPSLGLIPVEEKGKFYIRDNGLNIDITNMTSNKLYDLLDEQLPDEPEGNPPPKVGVKVGDPVIDKKNRKITGIYKGINPQTGKAMVEPMTKQQIKDYIKNGGGSV